MPATASRILIVDDDEGMLLLMGDSLRGAGYAVETAPSGWAALAALHQRRCDLMLLDLKLRDAAGADILTRLEREALVTPFIIVTGQGDERIAVEMMKRGALDYVMKDTAILDLLPVVVKRALASLERDRFLAAEQAERLRLEREVLRISERERERFGADLHDGIGQRLTAIELICAGLKGDVMQADPRLGERLGRIMDDLRETVAQTRALARGLAPLDEQPDALQTGLLQLARQAGATGRAQCRILALTDRPVADREAATHLLRIAQEAVNNALKHSGAKTIGVALKDEADGVVLEVTDDGQGMLGGGASGLGLGIMRYRANLIGANLGVVSAPGCGVSIRCHLPLTA